MTTQKTAKLTINLPKEWADHLIHLEKTTKKSKDDYIKEALFRNLEDIQDLQIGIERLKSKKKTYTPEEVNKKLGFK